MIRVNVGFLVLVPLQSPDLFPVTTPAKLKFGWPRSSACSTVWEWVQEMWSEGRKHLTNQPKRHLESLEISCRASPQLMNSSLLLLAPIGPRLIWRLVNDWCILDHQQCPMRPTESVLKFKTYGIWNDLFNPRSCRCFRIWETLY